MMWGHDENIFIGAKTEEEQKEIDRLEKENEKVEADKKNDWS